MSASFKDVDFQHVTPATRLLEKRRQVLEVQEALDAQKEEFERREELFKQREEQLRKKDIDLQESLIRFNKFLQENDSKRSRAEKKAVDEAKQRQAKEVELEQLRLQLNKLTQDKERMRIIVEKNMVFHKFLEDAILMTDDESFTEIGDLLLRHETLAHHHDDLMQRSVTFSALADEARARLQDVSLLQRETKLKGHNDVALLQKSLETTQLDITAKTRDLELKQITSSDKSLELGRIRWIVENLYERTKAKAKSRVRKVDDPAGRLQCTVDYLNELMYVASSVRQRQGTAASDGRLRE